MSRVMVSRVILAASLAVILAASRISVSSFISKPKGGRFAKAREVAASARAALSNGKKIMGGKSAHPRWYNNGAQWWGKMCQVPVGIDSGPAFEEAKEAARLSLVQVLEVLKHQRGRTHALAEETNALDKARSRAFISLKKAFKAADEQASVNAMMAVEAADEEKEKCRVIFEEAKIAMGKAVGNDDERALLKTMLEANSAYKAAVQDAEDKHKATLDLKEHSVEAAAADKIANTEQELAAAIKDKRDPEQVLVSAMARLGGKHESGLLSDIAKKLDQSTPFLPGNVGLEFGESTLNKVTYVRLGYPKAAPRSTVTIMPFTMPGVSLDNVFSAAAGAAAAALKIIKAPTTSAIINVGEIEIPLIILQIAEIPDIEQMLKEIMGPEPPDCPGCVVCDDANIGAVNVNTCADKTHCYVDDVRLEAERLKLAIETSLPTPQGIRDDDMLKFSHAANLMHQKACEWEPGLLILEAIKLYDIQLCIAGTPGITVDLRVTREGLKYGLNVTDHLVDPNFAALAAHLGGNARALRKLIWRVIKLVVKARMPR